MSISFAPQPAGRRRASSTVNQPCEAWGASVTGRMPGVCAGAPASGMCMQLTSNYTTDAITVAAVQALCSNGAPAWPVAEASISSVHAAMLAGNLTCSQLVGAYVQARALHRACRGL